MDRLTKEQMRAELLDLGETAPSSWNKTELKCRLMELKEANGNSVGKGKHLDKTPLQQAITKLNRVSKVKANLVKYAQEELMMEVTPNMTVSQIQRAAMNHMYEHVAVNEKDQVGFGRHSELTYQMLYHEYPQYCSWVRTTAREEKECSPQLKRLAMWLEQQVACPAGMNVTVPTMAMPVLKEPGIETSTSERMGRPPPQISDRQGAHGKPMTRTRTSAASSTQDEAVLQLVEVVKDLKSELEQLRGERPRKKDREAHSPAPSSFQMVNVPPGTEGAKDVK